VCYVDSQKACMWRIGLRRVMRFLGYKDKIVRILEALYQDTMSAVRVDSELSEWCFYCHRSNAGMCLVASSF